MATFKGTPGNDVLPPVGGNNSGTDTMEGLGGNDTLHGGAGNDTLRGGTGNDILQGQDGDDLLDGGAGADRFLGGAGQDTVTYFSSSAAVQLNLATNVNHGGLAEGDVFQDHIEIVHGSQFADTVLGSAGAETLRGFGGNDVLRGFGGNDVLEGGLGGDLLEGGDGFDTVSYVGSSAGVKINLLLRTASGGAAAGDSFASIESWVGSRYADTFTGGESAETFTGGGGVDVISYAGSTAAVTVNMVTRVGSGGTAASDRYLDSVESITGSAFNDRLIGGAGAGVISGGLGDDLLMGGAGADTFTGGDGFDTISYADSTAAVSVNLDTWANTGGTAQGDRFGDFIEGVVGSAFADTIVGGSLRTLRYTLSGGDGNDRLMAGDRSGGGDTRLEGDAGDDTLIGGRLSDVLDGGDGADILRGGDRMDILAGGTGNDRLEGGAGNDTLEGGAGADTFLGGAGTDTVSYAGSSAGVKINLFLGTASGGTAAGDSFADGIEEWVGSAFADTFIGGRVLNTFTGGAGIDTISYAGSPAAVTVDMVNRYGSGGTAERDRYADVFESITGSDFNDRLMGGAGNGVITGGLGNDLLMGGAGADTFTGGDGFDTISYADSTAAVSVNLDTWANTGGTAQGDRFGDFIEGVAGSAFADTIVGGSLRIKTYALSGGDGNDMLTAGNMSGGGDTRLQGDAGDDTLIGGRRSDVLDGGDGADVLRGGDWMDILTGGAGNDWLEGNSELNTLDGGAGNDTLIGGSTGYWDEQASQPYVVRDNTLTGGAGADRFVSEGVDAFLDSGSDRITDFSRAQGDRIDLSQIFSSIVFIGTGAFTGTAGQLRYEYDAIGNYTFLSLDRDGDGEGDFTGFTFAGNITLAAGDFIL